jgi:hypothetical protein
MQLAWSGQYVTYMEMELSEDGIFILLVENLPPYRLSSYLQLLSLYALPSEK